MDFGWLARNLPPGVEPGYDGMEIAPFTLDAEAPHRLSAARRAEKATQVAVTTNSFEAVAREWHATVHCARVSKGHAARTLIRLNCSNCFVNSSYVSFLKFNILKDNHLKFFTKSLNFNIREIYSKYFDNLKSVLICFL